jgi:hypothetical protein
MIRHAAVCIILVFLSSAIADDDVMMRLPIVLAALVWA